MAVSTELKTQTGFKCTPHSFSLRLLGQPVKCPQQRSLVFLSAYLFITYLFFGKENKGGACKLLTVK